MDLSCIAKSYFNEEMESVYFLEGITFFELTKYKEAISHLKKHLSLKRILKWLITRKVIAFLD